MNAGDVPYCSVFFTKIKEVFRLPDDFFPDSRPGFHRPGQQAQKFRPPIQPEVPDGPQQGGKQGEEDETATGGPHQDKAPKLAVRLPQNEQGQRRSGRQAVQQIQRAGQPGQPQPQGPQQVVQPSRSEPQQDGQEKGPQLLRDRNAHHRLSEQAAEKAPLTVRRILVGDGVDASVHKQFAAL